MNELKPIVEAALLAAGAPLTLDRLQDLFLEDERPEKKDLRDVIAELSDDYQGRGIELAEVGGGFRINVREAYAPWVSRLWEEKAPRYSRALLETLALIAYRQPITRGEIEEIRGVSVSSNIVKTLVERDWVRVVGTRDVPGKPSLYATTREFLNYFGLKSLDELPTLQQIRDLDSINRELELSEPGGDDGKTEPQDQLPVGEVDTGDQDEQQSDGERLAEVIAIHTESSHQVESDVNTVTETEASDPEHQTASEEDDER